MIFDETIYTALKDYVEGSLSQVEGVPDTSLKVEFAPSNMGEYLVFVKFNTRSN